MHINAIPNYQTVISFMTYHYPYYVLSLFYETLYHLLCPVNLGGGEALLILFVRSLLIWKKIPVVCFKEIKLYM